MKPGSRVFAIRSADADKVHAFGYGTYVGDRPRPGSGQWDNATRTMAEDSIRDLDENSLDFSEFYEGLIAEGKMTRAEVDAENTRRSNAQAEQRARPMSERVNDLLARMDLNPMIELDCGGVVWGFECWWCPAEIAEANFLRGREVVTVAAEPAHQPDPAAE